ncbi:MAG: YceD family protein [Cyanobacteria bacterium P01_A01_bin.45]
MDAIYIPQLTKAPERTGELQIKEFLPGLETLTPVRGKIRMQHCGNYLQIHVKAESIITLTCDRCLQQYNSRIAIDTSEIIWLEERANDPEELPLEREVAMEDLVESLSPTGHFYPSEWLYEQMCLAIPQRQLCDNKCPGIESANKSDDVIDSRWASLESLKKQFPS